MRFLSILRVRQGELPRAPDPMKPGFNEAAFHEAFLKYQDGSAEDLHVRNFGVLVASRVERIFATLKEMEKRSPRFSYDEMAKAVAAFAHKQQLALLTDYWSALADVTEITQESLTTQRTATDRRGNAFTPDEVLEAIIDGAKHVLRRARENQGFGGAGDQPEAVSVDAVASEVLGMGTGLEMLRRQWHAVLWGGAHVFVDPRPSGPYAIDKTASELERMASVDLQRRQVTIGRDTRELKELYLRNRLGERRVLAWGNSGGSAQRLVVTTIDGLPEEQRQMAIELAVWQKAQINLPITDFLEESHPSLKGTTYQQVLRAWYCLTLLVQNEYSEAVDDYEKFGEDSRPPITCLQSDQLNGALCEALDIQPVEAKAVINFLTYKGHHQTLWERPLLETKEGLLPMWWPLQCGHLMRLVADWGKANKKSEEKSKEEMFSDKGHRYEEMVHLMLSKLPTVENPAFRYLSLGPRLKVPDAAIGDVDAAFIIDRTLFVLECRDVGYPAEAFEFWNTREELQKKIEQALRKKDYLASNPEVVASWVERAHPMVTVPKIERVVALVLSNSFLLEGERAHQPYFIHTDTLYNALLSGYSSFGGGFDADGKEVEYHVDFRKEGVPDADAFLRALKHPPKAEAYKACITTLDTSIPGFDESDSAGMMRSPVVTMPEHGRDVEALLQRCSFVQQVRRVTAA
ncbi:hypothetical protein Q3O98_25050 [Ralstonia pseudosolanacearum]|uniref:hypothetical protein n=1 Tax=Ralstonia pseudosolanacearum TaxID=1310165 RepID=UPI002677450A|nr:hypothetical protein [Ralstonia pseudosolanacearum]MDO3624346.1 hypothetical protein [Ralstonia pseudosolanacearum]